MEIGAAKIGDVEVLQWLHEYKNYGFRDGEPLVAARCGHLRAVQWFHQYHPDTFRGLSLMDAAAENGHLDVVQWLHENNMGECSSNGMDRAARNGHLNVVLYLLENRQEGFPRDLMTSTREVEVHCQFNADSSSHLNQANRAQLNMSQSNFKARHSFVQVCLRSLAKIALHKGFIEVLDWIQQFGLELRSTAPIRDAARHGDMKLLQWFYKNGFEMCEPKLLLLAIESEEIDAVHWLLKHGHTINPLKLAHISAIKKNVPLLRCLVEHGPPLSLRVAMRLVMEFRYEGISLWISEPYRVHIVLEALRKDDREVLWWILTRTTFECEKSRCGIRERVLHAPSETFLWLQNNLVDSACSWCLTTT